jgi:drug/metabolite transporter (DMT)-like permease
MSWFFIALAGPILYSLANHTDKYLISKYVKGGAVGSLIIFSALFGIVALPLILLVQPDVLTTPGPHRLVLVLNGMLIVFAILCYFYALHKDEASHVVPFYQTIPIFGFILGYLVLGETISTTQGLASLVVIVGALILSFELGDTIRFRKQVVILMLTASLLYSVNGVLFKLVALNDGFWTSMFWSIIGQVLLGIFFLVFIKSYRRQFVAMIRENRVAALGLNALSEIFFTVAEMLTAFATLLAPVVLVLLVNSFQPLFVFIFGVFLSLFLPHISQESLMHKHLLQKILGIGLIITGGYFIGT